jgi:peptidoglycan/xylan/chitin deacetylase (PgdA/CDA1 family)
MDALTPFESWLARTSGTLLSRSGRAASLLVMIYHRVLEKPDPMMPGEPDAATFAAHVRLFAENFHVLPLEEGVERLHQGSLPARAVCITFDDGYANNCDIAMPILTARRVPATVFVAPGFLNGGHMFNDAVIESVRHAPRDFDLRPQGLSRFDLIDAASRVRAVAEILNKIRFVPPPERLQHVQKIALTAGVTQPPNLMMTDAQVVKLVRGGIDVGAHTMHHPILTRVSREEARQEILDSKRRLEDLTGKPIRTFAYPNGKPSQDYDRTHVDLVKEAGFELAVSTAWGAATAGSDPYQIPRIAPWDTRARRYAARMVNAYRARRFVTV